jgi:hypothetical protein
MTSLCLLMFGSSDPVMTWAAVIAGACAIGYLLKAEKKCG